VIRYLLKDKEVIACNEKEYDEWRKSLEYVWHIGDDTINNYRVSTIFMGRGHNFWGGPPLVFETMVFGHNKEILEQERYSTYEEAEKGHKEMIEKYLNKRKKMMNDEIKSINIPAEAILIRSLYDLLINQLEEVIRSLCQEIMEEGSQKPLEKSLDYYIDTASNKLKNEFNKELKILFNHSKLVEIKDAVSKILEE
jgi:hypothetical protein